MRKRLYAKNKVLLAASIMLSRPALYRLFARPDHPPQVPGKGYNIEQWQRYADENVATWNRRDPHRNDSNGSKPTNPRDIAYIERQKIEAERAQFNLDVEREKYWPKEKAKGLIARNFGILVRELEKAFIHEIPPKDEGLSAGEIMKLHRRRLHEIQTSVKKLLDAA